MSDSSTFSVLKSSVYREPIQFQLLKLGENFIRLPKMLLNISPQIDALSLEGNKAKGFNSFRLALEFPECLDEVDVISDADNIKTLLKLPEIPDTTISMLVHKVGNALLLDDFGTNIIKSKDDWKMFTTFLNLKNDDDSYINNEFEFLSKTIDDNYDDKMLLANFLSYSVEPFNVEGRSFSEIEYNTRKPFKTLGSDLPEPRFEHAIPLSKHSCSFKQNVVWNFAGIQMLVGTNTNIFKTDKYPCVSLKLKDALTPFTSKTGKDYWLDNMMLDIPEVLICHHFKGFVKKYELIKTVDLPKKQNCRFSINVTRNVAKKIINTLKAFVTNRGHTYWLYKDNDTDYLLLYDLTSLCEKGEIRHVFPETPFTVPIAMLHYTLALKMLSSIDKLSDGQTALLYELLMYCVKLVPEKMYTEIMASVYYLISDLCIPNDLNFVSEESYNSNFETNWKQDVFELGRRGVYIQNIFEAPTEDAFEEISKKPSILFNSLYDRCDKALIQIVAGIQYCDLIKKLKKNCVRNNRMFVKQEKLAILDNQQVELLNCSENINGQPNTYFSWGFHIKLLLIRKASVVYAIKQKLKFSEDSFGESLNLIYMSIRCQNFIQELSKPMLKDNYLISCARESMQTIIYYFENFDAYLKDYQHSSPLDKYILNNMSKSLRNDEALNEFIEVPVKNLYLLINKCLNLYESVLIHTSDEEYLDVLSHLGKDCGKLGTIVLAYANDFYEQNFKSDLDEAEKEEIDNYFLKLISVTFSCNSMALFMFAELNDKLSLAFLFFDKASIYRGSTQIFRNVTTLEEFNRVTGSYKRALASYDEARTFLVSKEHSPGLWDTIDWQQGSTYMELVSFMRKHFAIMELLNIIPSKVSLDFLHRALSLCTKSKILTDQYLHREGVINAQIALCEFDEIMLKIYEPTSIRNIQQLYELHNKKAIDIFKKLQCFSEYFNVNIERLRCQQVLADTAVRNNKFKVNNLVAALDICLETICVFNFLASSNETFDELLERLTLFESYLQAILKHLIQVTIRDVGKQSNRTPLYKKMYFHTLHTIKFPDEISFVKHLIGVLTKLTELKDQKLD